ncbi:DNA-binding transcriptional regulator, LysR family [Nocardioides exalbidus]|uniref:DNA-binding transcriptional regulator, LysR family n=1 Tax=Nocardioides exalbidus TaxID=402596 RepID=A0A1H4L4K6_9ACTN|nr:LysR family transcriptional regulator [Nocardioides exalbidus]SEB65697.1 DNA-binding transcriptional regulator, LysR family [Nocardioides exalbidus]
MERILDIGPLRSLVAVADHGGFQRAAEHLHLSQGGVSQHVRRLEAATGLRLVERHGRGSRFTPEGERLLASARGILAAHDDALRDLAGAHLEVTIGSTEHAAARLLPSLSAALEDAGSRTTFRYRIDRGARLREGLASGQVDLALLLNAADHPGAVPVGALELTWYAAASWRLPVAPDPVPVVAFDNPCELRKRALQTLADHGVPATIGAEATQLAGVQAAVSAGLGVALMALDEPPPGLVAVSDLPTPEPLTLYVCPRAGLADDVVALAADAVAAVLAGSGLALTS